MDTEETTVESLQLLIAQKDAIEAELLSTRSWLVAPGNLGLSGGLLDEEGFPINDVDKIIATREARGKLARLQNDHMDIMKKIESGIYDLHMKARAEGKVQAVAVTTKETPISPPPAPETLDAKYSHLTPIASVNSVAQLSPAFKANLQTGDLILAFGSADSSSGGFAKIKECVEENKSITTVIKRKGEDGHHFVLELTLTPTKWAGPGLLGCHLLPA